MMSNIAFIGLGNMGSGMCANLARAGHQVRAFDLNAEAVAKAVATGAVAATVDLRHHPVDLDTLGDAVSVTPVGAGVAVFIGKVHAETNCRGFFTSVQVNKAWNFTCSKFFMDTVLKGPDLTHLAVGL